MYHRTCWSHQFIHFNVGTCIRSITRLSQLDMNLFPEMRKSDLFPAGLVHMLLILESTTLINAKRSKFGDKERTANSNARYIVIEHSLKHLRDMN